MRVPVEQVTGLGEDRHLARSDRPGERADVNQLGVDVGDDARAGRLDREVRVNGFSSRNARMRVTVTS